MVERYPEIKIILVGIVVWLASACSLYGPRQHFGDDGTTEVIVYFKNGVTEKGITEFWDVVLGQPDPRQGIQLQPGLAGVSRSRTIQGYASLAIYYKPAVTVEQRAQITKRITESRLVYKVLEDTIPNEVGAIE